VRLFAASLIAVSTTDIWLVTNKKCELNIKSTYALAQIQIVGIESYLLFALGHKIRHGSRLESAENKRDEDILPSGFPRGIGRSWTSICVGLVTGGIVAPGQMLVNNK